MQELYSVLRVEKLAYSLSKTARGLLFFFNREKRSFIPDSQIEELSYSLRKDREASYSLLTNRNFFRKRIEKFSYSLLMDIRAILILINKWEGSLFLY